MLCFYNDSAQLNTEYIGEEIDLVTVKMDGTYVNPIILLSEHYKHRLPKNVAAYVCLLKNYIEYFSFILC